MKIYTARASLKKLKYYEEQIHFTANGTSEYDWRKIYQEIKDLEVNLSLPEKLVFVTDNIDFNDINEYDWLKSDFCLPILSKRFSEYLSDHGVTHKIYPLEIRCKDDSNVVSYDYVGFYVMEYFDCLVRDGSVRYEYRSASFQRNLNYPKIFKIQDLETPFMHFVTESAKSDFEGLEFLGIDFQAVWTI